MYEKEEYVKMSEIKDVEKIERTLGIASTVQAKDIVPVYSEAVQRFLKDNERLGEDWQRQAAGYLLDCFKGTDNEGNIKGSNIYAGVAIATLTDIPLIRGRELLRMWETAGRINPFGSVYVDFGVQANGMPKVSSAQASVLLQSLKKYNLKEDVVPDFCQLRLVPDQNSGLVFKIADNVEPSELAPVSQYPFEGRVGRDGLFRACLSSTYWFANGDCLGVSIDDGRVVRYDAEGVAPKMKIIETRKDLASELAKRFSSRF
jgi:hypothetical protein